MPVAAFLAYMRPNEQGSYVWVRLLARQQMPPRDAANNTELFTCTFTNIIYQYLFSFLPAIEYLSNIFYSFFEITSWYMLWQGASKESIVLSKQISKLSSSLSIGHHPTVFLLNYFAFQNCNNFLTEMLSY